MRKIIIVLLSCILFNSCAMLLAKRQTVHVNSTPTGAKVYSGNNYVGMTPCNFTTKRAKPTLYFEKEGYYSSRINTQTKFRSGFWWNLMFTGFFGLIVDIPYAMKYTQTNYNVELNPRPVAQPTPQLITNLEQYAPSSVLAEIVRGSNMEEMKAQTIFKKYNSAVFMIFTRDARGEYQGSGFFISPNGIAISNYHVFKNTYKGLEIIKLHNGKQYKIKEVLAYSEKYDYILFRVEGKFNYIPVSKKKYEIGDKIYTIGSPKGLENTFSSGEISQIRSNSLIQINAPIDHGSSGGALINAQGEAIGITSGGRDDSGANLNYAIDINVIFKK